MKKDWLWELIQKDPRMLSDMFVRSRLEAQNDLVIDNIDSIEAFIDHAKKKRIMSPEAIEYYIARKTLRENSIK